MRSSVAILAFAAAVRAMPQAVTAVIAPTGTAPAGCSTTFSGTFGLAVLQLGQVTALPDGQPRISTVSGRVTTIADGQPQAPTGVSRVSVISDGQPQAPTAPVPAPVGPVSLISDGQPQAPTGAPAPAPVSVISDGQPQAPTGRVPLISVISDGQPQAPTGTVVPVSVISDGQPQAPTVTMIPIGQIGDGQIQQHTTTIAVVSQISDGQIQATRTSFVTSVIPNIPAPPPTNGTGPGVMVGCNSTSSLQLSLSGGILKDNRGRIGYIASNRQFQFDGPPQAGAIYTAGWSVCSNGTLALGGRTTFYRCLSGSFFNLYDRSIGGQCNPITLNAIRLITC